MNTPLLARQLFALFPHLLLYGLLLGAVLLHSTPAAADPLAADLVQDGQAIDLKQEKYRLLFAELTQKHQFTPDELHSIFQGQTINRQILVLMDKQWEAKPYYQYAPLFLTPDNIRDGKDKITAAQGPA